MNKNYNMEEGNFNEVRNLLKNLPRISASGDFDNELKRKLISLQNKPQKKKVFAFRFKRALIPAAAFGLTSIILFFVFSGKDEQNVNPFLLSPQQRIHASYNNNAPFKVNSNDVVINEDKTVAPNEIGSQNPSAPKIDANNLYRERIRELIANSYGNNVDRSLRAKPESTTGFNSRGATVNFNGFNIIQEDEDVIDGLRARMDSIKKIIKEKDKK